MGNVYYHERWHLENIRVSLLPRAVALCLKRVFYYLYYHAPHQPTSNTEVSSLRQDESSKRGDESQQIAAWQLLYRVQHPARYLSRLQTIPSPDIDHTYPWSTVWSGTTISQVRSPAAVPLRPARQTWALVGPPINDGWP